MFVLASKHRDLHARYQHALTQLTTARAELANWKGSAIRTAGRNTVLAERLDIARGAVLVDNEYVGQLEARLGRVLRACVRYRASIRRLERDNARLQARLDDGLGLNTPAMDEGARWQERRADLPRPRTPKEQS